MIIEAENINFTYTKGTRQILKDVNLTLEEGQVMSILGPNGAGKSTLLNCIATLNELDSGTIKLCGKDVRKMKQKEVAAFVPTSPEINP